MNYKNIITYSTILLSVIANSSLAQAEIKTSKVCLDNNCINAPKEFNYDNCGGPEMPDMSPWGFDTNESNKTQIIPLCSKGNILNYFTYGITTQKMDLKSQFNLISKNREGITYKNLGKNHFVMSGITNMDNIFYQATKKVGTNRYLTFDFQYPKKDKKKYDNYLNTLVKNFLKGV
jgi:hypothetical protein